MTGKSHCSASARALRTPAASRSPHDAPPPRGGAAGATGPGGTQRHRSSRQRHPRLFPPSRGSRAPARAPPRPRPRPSARHLPPRGGRKEWGRAPHRSAPEELRAPPPASPVWPEARIRLVDWSWAASLLAEPLTDWRRSRGARAEAVGGQAGRRYGGGGPVRAGRAAPAVPAAELLPEVRVAPPGLHRARRGGTGPGPHSLTASPGRAGSRAGPSPAAMLHPPSAGPPAPRRGAPSYRRDGPMPASQPLPPCARSPLPLPRGSGPVWSADAAGPEGWRWRAGMGAFSPCGPGPPAWS